jgi:hypothetical protein
LFDSLWRPDLVQKEKELFTRLVSSKETTQHNTSNLRTSYSRYQHVLAINIPRSLHTQHLPASSPIANMKASIFLTSAVCLSTAAASKRSNAEERRSVLEQRATNGSCPKVWFDIAADLQFDFAGCHPLAASAIRFAFHDAGEINS